VVLGGSFQIYRYRRDSTPVERQQIKWILLGVMSYVLGVILWVLVFGGVLQIPVGKLRLLAVMGWGFSNIFTLTGQSQSPLVIVLSTLAIAALFNPLRRRIQEIINRRFSRQKYDMEQTMENFAKSARGEVELDALTGELLQVVQQTMKPEQVSLWLRKS